MRKAILDENKRVIGFEPMKEEMSEQAKAQRQKQIDFVVKKYGLNKGAKKPLPKRKVVVKNDRKSSNIIIYGNYLGIMLIVCRLNSLYG
jgi:hypothetical protein